MNHTPVDRPIPATCPAEACGASLRYGVAARLLRCPACGWSRHLDADAARPLVFALAGAGDLGAVVAALAATPPAPAPARTLPTGKRVVPRGKDGESEWEQLMRLGTQAALNHARVTPLGYDCRYFEVLSQVPGRVDRYEVRFGALVTCTCERGKHHPGAPCAHIGAVYSWLLQERRLASRSVAARAAEATDLLWPAA